MVYTRTAIAAAGLAVVALWKRRSLSPFTPDIGQYLLTSLLITAHWFTFFLAIKISTASIAAACLSTSTVFTALLEPFWFKRKLRMYEVVLGVIVVAALGVDLRLGERLPRRHSRGHLERLVERMVQHRERRTGEPRQRIADRVLRNGRGGACSRRLPPIHRRPSATACGNCPRATSSITSSSDSVCTSFAFVAGIAVMRQLSPFTVVLTVNLEPVYTILIALLIWGSEEQLRTGSYLGIALILACLLVNSWYQKRRKRNEVIEPDPLSHG